MQHMKKAIALALAVSLSILNFPLNLQPARADDSDIFGANIQPNVLILLDTSGSMSNLISTWPFEPATTYSGSKVASPNQGKVYKKTSTGYSVYKNSISQVPNGTARTALTNNGFWSGTISGTKYNLFTGNYLNWQDDPRTTEEKKIDIAKKVINDLVNNTEGIRFGLMKFANNGVKGDGGGEIVAPIGSTKGDITTSLGGLSPTGWTPLGEQMRDAGKYYRGEGDYYGKYNTTPIQYECQPNFVILISDGLENGTLQVAAEASQRNAQDHSSTFAGKQNVIVHTVGFAIDPGEKDAANDVLQQAAKNGGGSFYYADNAPQLEAALQDAIRQIVAATFSFATPVVPTTSATGSDKAYLAAFQSNPSRPFWRGFLKAFQRDANGNVPVDSNGVPLDSALVWEAGDKLSKKAASSRNIYTLIGGTRQDFAKSNANLTDAVLNTGSSVYRYQFKDKDNITLTRDFTKQVASGALSALDIKMVKDVPGASAPPGCSSDCFAYNPNGGDPTSIPAANLGYVGDLDSAVYGSGTKLTNLVLQSSSTITRDALIDFIRGIDSIDEDGDASVTEERAWKLGDIFHSSPVLVTPPIGPSTDASYVAFRDAQKTRPTILLAAANDGMVHAFQEKDGEELWSFIPPDQLGRLKLIAKLSGSHPFYADSSVVVTDVKIGSTWKTIAVFGERRGGRNYFALDVTDTTNPQYLWSFTDSKMGETWSEPAIGKVKMADGTENFVAIVGGGYDTDENNVTGKAVFAIDLSNGTKLWEYYNNASSDDRQYMNYSIPANPTISDLNLDGYVDRLYIGDVGGQVWKFDLSAAATLSGGLVTNWTGKRLFAGSPSQANPPEDGEYYPEQGIYAAITPAYDDQGNLWIYFGTGDRNHPNNTTAPNRFYGIKDNTSMTNGSALTESNLVDITSSNANASQGWYFRLGADEKVLSSADVFNKVVFFSTFTPTSTSACASGGGEAKLYAVQMLTGYAAVDFSSGVALASTDASKTRSKTIGTGIPSKPVIVITESGTTISTSVIAATTSQQLPSNPAPPPSAMRKVLYWREAF